MKLDAAVKVIILFFKKVDVCFIGEPCDDRKSQQDLTMPLPAMNDRVVFCLY